MTAEPLDELIALLSAEARTYRALLPLLADEASCLRKAHMPGLAGLRVRREEMLAQLTELDRARRAALGTLARRLDVDTTSLTVSRLIELVPRPPAALVALRDELRGLLTQMLNLSIRNRFLAERTLGCLRGLLSQLAAAVLPPPVYAESGRPDRADADFKLLDRRA
jgi:flagellar biosynthesis/type III secretory pathway chaperone